VAGLVVIWFTFTGIGPWAGVNAHTGEEACARVGTNRDGSEQWWCERGETPNRVTYDRATDSYLIRACTRVRARNRPRRDDSVVYSCREEVG
jgi:hypothetical protein